MAPQATELFFLQHLAQAFHIPAPEFLTGEATGAEIRKAMTRWGGKALVKPDVLAGRRGKAGAVHLVQDYVSAQKELKRIGGLEVNGRLPRTAYLVQYIPGKREIYTAITYDSRFNGPSITVSLDGGMDVEQIPDEKKVTLPVDVYKGLDAYQASELLGRLGLTGSVANTVSLCLVDFWDLFITTGMRTCEINPWRITPEGKCFACDFKAVFDEANFKYKNLAAKPPEYPAQVTLFEEEMSAWNASSHQGQAHAVELGGDMVLPILFGGGASTIIAETLLQHGGNPIILSDFGGNPPYERMLGTARICFEHHLGKAAVLLILGGKANNTLIDVTFQSIADALRAYVDAHGPIHTPVVVGRGGPRLVKGMLILRDALSALGMPYVIFGPDTPVTQVAEYAATLARASKGNGGVA
ncbi:MAG: hypothetical protein NTV86_07725 [Planctomycetota bacterium]|nr:hypothetical protein [Planctomycetota bacterium]